MANASSLLFEDLDDGKGTYILLLHAERALTIDIGRLGQQHVRPGFYAYVGSAFGAGGLRARLRHHTSPLDQPHWHIDYLRHAATPREAWITRHHSRLEQTLAEFLRKRTPFQPVIPRFGASEYRRAKTTHLFHTRKKPSFQAFMDQVSEYFDKSVVFERVVLA